MCGILYFYVVVYIIDTYIFLIKFCVHCMLKLYMSRAIWCNTSKYMFNRCSVSAA